MGGWGSSRWEGHHCRPGVEETDCIRLRDLRHSLRNPAAQRVVINSGGCPPCPFTVVLSAMDDVRAGTKVRGIRLLRGKVGAGGALQGETADVLGEPTRFGGERWFLVCPACHRRCLALFRLVNADRRPPMWGCRTCHGLGYQSQRLSTVDRANERLRAVGRRLDRTCNGAVAFPARPPRMRWATYLRLADRWIAARDRRDALVAPLIAAIRPKSQCRLERLRRRHSD